MTNVPSTTMCYGNVFTGMKALTFNKNTLMLVEAATGGVK